jgi:hypothetical protein
MFGKNSKLVVFAVLILMGLQGVQFAEATVPSMTVYWQEALEFLGTQEVGGVFTWWDYGSWIQGATGFPTILDTVAGQSVGRMREVGGILLETDATAVDDFFEKYDIRYVVVSTDMIGQMHNVNSILGRPQVGYIILLFEGSATVGDTMGSIYGDQVFVFDTGETKVAMVQDGDEYYAIRNIVYREKGSLIYHSFTESDLPFVEGMLYVSQHDLFVPIDSYEDYAVFVEPKLERTFLNSAMLLDGRGFPSLEMIYRNPQVSVYKVRTSREG